MKYFMSESIQAGQLPLWNPYINYGIPQYGDMSGGYWNPITWLIASTVGYNAWTFTIENLLYIFLAGIGMYKLASKFTSIKKIAIIAGVSYMCCGYNVGHLQHLNWLSGAAFLPWCVWAYMNLQDNISVKKLAAGGLAFYFMLSSAHPGIIIGAFYLFLACAIYYFFTKNNQEDIRKRLLKFSKLHLFLALFIAVLSTGMLFAYIDFIPHFSRGEKIGLQSSLLFPTTFQSWISFVLPLSTVKNADWFATDISMRNIYFGLTLFLVFLTSLWRSKNKWQWFLLATGVFFLLLSTGSGFKKFAYDFIPFIGYIRLNGEFRIFSILCFILLSVIELDKYVKQERKTDRVFYITYYVVEILLIAAIIWSLVQSVKTGDSLLSRIPAIMNANGFSLKFKMGIDSLSFYDTLWLQGTIQLFALWAIKYCLKHRTYYLLVKVCIAEIVLACLLNVPFTGAGKASVAHVQSVYDRAPKGIPVPKLNRIADNDSLSVEESSMVGQWSFYNKQPGVVFEAPYPIKLSSIKNYLTALDYRSDSTLITKPFIFLENANDSSMIAIKKFSTNEFTLEVSSRINDKLIIQQSIYPHWKIYVDGVEKDKLIYKDIFLSVNITPSTKEVKFRFDFPGIIFCMIISLLTFLSYIFLIYRERFGRQRSKESI